MKADQKMHIFGDFKRLQVRFCPKSAVTDQIFRSSSEFYNNIMVSTHSACSSKLDIGSPTLTAMGKDPVLVKNAMRFSFSTLNTKEEIDRLIEVFEFGLKEIRG